MALQVTFIFLCAGFTGIQGVSTVGHVSVEVGGTVHIPCIYEDEYRGNVKYLCRGPAWKSCTYEIKTNEQKYSAKYSINDNKTQRIVTFTIKYVEFSASDYYWCIVEKSGTDDGKQFQLSVTAKGESKLYVDSQMITGYFDQVTIPCKYRGCGSKRWCRLGGPCVTSGRIGGALVTIDTRSSGLFVVTMTELREQNIGWYWCSCGDLQMPVFVHLTQRPTTTTIVTTTSSTATLGTTPDFSSNESHGTSSVNFSDYIKAAVISLVLLIFIVVVSLVIWHKLKTNMKKTNIELSSPEQSADDPVYSNVSNHPTSHLNPECADKETEIMYSSVSFIKKQASEKVKVEEEDVVYSPLALH